MKLIAATVLLSLFISPCFAEEKKGPKVTNKVFFDISIDGKEAGMFSWGITVIDDL